jgi:hypothetical protein
MSLQFGLDFFVGQCVRFSARLRITRERASREAFKSRWNAQSSIDLIIPTSVYGRAKGCE